MRPSLLLQFLLAAAGLAVPADEPTFAFLDAEVRRELPRPAQNRE